MKQNNLLSRSDKIDFLNGIKEGTAKVQQIIPQPTEVWEVGENGYTNKKTGKFIISDKFDLIKKQVCKINGLLLVVDAGKSLIIYGEARAGGKLDDTTFYTFMEACNNGYEIKEVSFVTIIEEAAGTETGKN
jgi:hypothetical protein